MNGPGAIGRTLAGKRLDAFVGQLRDRRLRRRIYRTCAHIDRDFRSTIVEGEWYRGFLYMWWNETEFARRFPRKAHAELRQLLEDYSDSLFQEDYQPETNTQKALIRAANTEANTEMLKKWRRKHGEAVWNVKTSAAFLGAFLFLSFLTNSTFLRICMWFLTLVNITSLSHLNTVERSRPIASQALSQGSHTEYLKATPTLQFEKEKGVELAHASRVYEPVE